MREEKGMDEEKEWDREQKCAKNYNNWHSKIFFLNCNQHFDNFKPLQFPSAVW